MITKIRDIYRSKAIEYSYELESAYLDYTTNISNKVMAASLRCCVFLMCIYDATKPNKIIDLGSGFSSYALRYFKNKFNVNTEIYSVDSNKDWLIKSKEFCKNNNVDVSHFYSWDDIKNKVIPFDLIFMDIDKTKKRISYYDHIYNHFLSKNTFMLVDDLHKPLIRNKIKHIDIKHKKHRVYDETIDKFKRFSSLIEFGGK
jgi:predicted O-methyltransferase YrrM